MDINDFYFELPKGKIAQTPCEKRDCSKLLVLNKKTGEIKHKKFYNLIDFLTPNDCLVLNNSKVFFARVFGVNKKTSAKLEFLLLKQQQKDVWSVLAKPAKRARVGEVFNFSNMLTGVVLKSFEFGQRWVKFFYSGDFYEILEQIGNIPLPPYIKKPLKNSNRYQTVYNKEIGSCAAPTAGLHFTKNMLKKIEEKGVLVAFLTLHVGLGTFLPVKEKNIKNHKMHSEEYFLSESEAKKIEKAKLLKKKVFCVGTTSCRTLETIAKKNDKICEDCGSTDIFIYPGFKFKAMDGLITNFHLPKSTLLMLVSAFAGHEKIKKAYKEAIEKDYKFFSFGDAMLIY